MTQVEQVPANADFMRSDGSTATVTPELKRIADALLAAGWLKAGKPGQRIIDAVWNARTTLDVLELAGVTAVPTAEVEALRRVAHAAWHLLDDGGDEPDEPAGFISTKLQADETSAALDDLEAAGWAPHPGGGRVKLLGYCESCRRIKQVRVSGAGMAQVARRGLATGTCDACEDAAEQERRRHDEQRRAQRGHTKWGRRP